MNHPFVITQHFMDALGRETNTVVTAVGDPGSAYRPDCWTLGFAASETTTYPDGIGDHVVHVDRRGVRTVSTSRSFANREENVTLTFSPANPDVCVVASTNIAYRNGRSIAIQSWDGGWTRETHWTEYTPAGLQRDIVVSEASDSIAVTNSVTTLDFLGRVASILKPGANGTTLTTQYAYDGSSSRVSQSSTTGSPAVTYIYDDLKNRVATVRNDTAAWSDTSYATIGNEIWKIETQSRVTDGVTNGVTVMRSQLTGLSNALRSRTVNIAPNGSTTTEESVFDASTQQLTTRVWTDDATPNVTVSKFGHAICEINADERTESCFDPHGRAFFRTTCHPVSNAHLYDYWADFDASGNIVHHELYDGNVFITGQSTYDAWNRETSRTDAEGETVHAAYDIAGRPVAIDGATYPIRTRYDTAGRKTGSLTTRDDKATWDETQWRYDPRTGLVTNKVYANSTTVGHSYLANGLPERTTWARGAWKELRYDDRNQVASNLYASVATPSVHRAYSKSGRIASATDAAGTDYRYAYNDNLALTNETVVIEGRTFEIDRAVDDRQREVRTSVASSHAIHAATTRIFDSEGRLAELALTNAQKRGISVVYGYDGSYLTNSTTTLPNGSTFRHALSRNASRRALVNRHDYAFNGSPLLWHACEHDLLGRATSTMDSASVARDYLYNARSEVVAASIGTNEYGYVFDTIGNRRTATENAAATIYSANCLNQYTQVDQTALSYDADGNLLGDGMMQYAYDDENRLVSAVPANPTNAVRVINRYDYRHRRVQKRVERFSGGVWQVQRTHTFVHDGWNPAVERIDAADGTSRTIEYFWGNDLSGTPQGAGGIGGLLAVSLDGSFYVPCYDHNGNVVAYIDEAGTPVARYAYDPFGNTIEQTGALADTFALRFSTKHFDAETGLYYYGRRFYSPGLGRWLNRDPIEEDGGLNLYAFCGNDGVNAVDPLGRKVWIVTGDMPVFSDKVADINQMVDVARKKVINKMNALFSSKSIGRIRFYIRTQTPSQSNYTDINERGVDIQTFF